MKLIIGLVAPLLSITLMTASCSESSMMQAEQSANEAAPDFKAALDAHLKTIADRDLEAFTKTLTQDGDLNIIFPNGALLPDNTAAIDFHRDWFADKDWIMEPEVVKIIEGSDLATALLKYDYRDNDAGEPRSNWLVLTFQLEDGAWKLVHDQNTKIE